MGSLEGEVDPLPQIFRKLRFVIDDGFFNAKDKRIFVKSIKDHGGTVDMKVNAKTNYFITKVDDSLNEEALLNILGADDAKPPETSEKSQQGNYFKRKSAVDLGVRWVSKEFVEQSILAQELLDYSAYLQTPPPLFDQQLSFDVMEDDYFTRTEDNQNANMEIDYINIHKENESQAFKLFQSQHAAANSDSAEQEASKQTEAKVVEKKEENISQVVELVAPKIENNVESSANYINYLFRKKEQELFLQHQQEQEAKELQRKLDPLTPQDDTEEDSVSVSLECPHFTEDGHHIVKYFLFQKAASRHTKTHLCSVELHTQINSVEPANTNAGQPKKTKIQNWRIFVHFLETEIAQKAVQTETSLCFCGMDKEGITVMCHQCEQWYHGSCVGVTPRNKHLKFICWNCLHPDEDEEDQDEVTTTTTTRRVRERIVCRFINDGPTTQELFDSIFRAITASLGYYREDDKSNNILHDYSVGSPQLLQLFRPASHLSAAVTKLVDTFYSEAASDITSNLGVSLASLTATQVDQAESLLLHMLTIIQGDFTPVYRQKKLAELSREYFKIIPQKHAQTTRDDDVIHTLEECKKQQELLQLVRDLVNVTEVTGSSTDTSSRYAALECTIKDLNKQSPEYQHVETWLKNQEQDYSRKYSTQVPQVTVRNVYSLAKKKELQSFKNQIGNIQTLVHGSKVRNFLGIVSRGLLLPKAVVSQGVVRTDAGMLGAGIYFNDNFFSSIKYCGADASGSMYMLLCQVALGNVRDYNEIEPTLTRPPDGYNSTHGVRSTEFAPSQFADNEFVVYDVAQQHIQYIVEFSVADLPTKPKRKGGFISINPLAGEGVVPCAVQVETSEAPEAGLVASDGSSVPLHEVSITATVLDFVAEVSVYQMYYNNQNHNIEAKYVFPLDEKGSVSAFEAFINDKHLVGVVEEKETAQRQYEDAIASNKGAYLLQEESPDVFTVAVGNIPPRTAVLIKITYVTELGIDTTGEPKPIKTSDLSTEFSVPKACTYLTIPAKMTSSQKQSAINRTTQNRIDTQNVMTTGHIRFSMKISVQTQMPLEALGSTHLVKFKQSQSKAVVELIGDHMLDSDFKLYIFSSQLDQPRLWIEADEANNHQAAMVCFYPNFPASSQSDQIMEFIFLIDQSTSMRGQLLEDVKRHMLLSLDYLVETYKGKNRRSAVLPTCKFNIYGYGTSFYQLFEESMEISHNSKVQQARDHIKKLQPTLGGSNLNYVLKSIFLASNFQENVNRTVILFSDGQIAPSEYEVTLETVRAFSSENRLFCFGVGNSESCNRQVLSTLARIGRGLFESLPFRSQSKNRVHRILSLAAQPTSKGLVSIDWGIDHHVPFQSPTSLNALYKGEACIVYAFLNEAMFQCTLMEETPDGKKNTLSTAHVSNECFRKGTIIHKLTVSRRIREILDGTLDKDAVTNEMMKRNLKTDAINMSKKYNILCQYTSFIAIEEDRDSRDLEAETPSITELIERDFVDELPHSVWNMSETAREIEEEILQRQLELEAVEEEDEEEDPFGIHRRSNEDEDNRFSVKQVDEDDEDRFGIQRDDQDEEERFGVRRDEEDEDDKFGIRRDYDDEEDVSKFNIEREEVGYYQEPVSYESNSYDYGVLDTTSYEVPAEEDPFSKYMAEESKEQSADRFSFPVQEEEEDGEMRFSLFDDDEPEASSGGLGVAGAKATKDDADLGSRLLNLFGGARAQPVAASAAPVRKEEPRKQEKRYYEEREEEDMGFGLFDDGPGFSYSAPSRSVWYQEPEEEPDMGFGLFDGGPAPSFSAPAPVVQSYGYGEEDDEDLMGADLFGFSEASVPTPSAPARSLQRYSEVDSVSEDSLSIFDDDIPLQAKFRPARAPAKPKQPESGSTPVTASKKLVGGIRNATSSASLTAEQKQKLAEHSFTSNEVFASYTDTASRRVKVRPPLPSNHGGSGKTSVKSSRHFGIDAAAASSSSSSSRRSGGGVGRFRLFKKWRQERSAGFIKEYSLPNTVLTPLQQNIHINQQHIIQTGFGVSASLATKLIQQHNLIYLFKGPKNQNSSCWLDAAIGLALTIVNRIALSTVCRKNHHRYQMDTEKVAPYQDLVSIASNNNNKTVIDETDLKFLNELFAVYCFWTHVNQTQSGYHKKMTELVNSLWKQFEPFGFRMGDPACVIASFKLILTKLEKFLNKQEWQIVELDKNFASNTVTLQTNPTAQFIICINEGFSEISPNITLSVKNSASKPAQYSLYSFTTFEPLFHDIRKDKPINHFVTSTIDKDQQFITIYDDLLSIKPGGHQGVVMKYEANDPRVSRLFRRVPILVFAKK